MYILRKQRKLNTILISSALCQKLNGSRVLLPHLLDDERRVHNKEIEGAVHLLGQRAEVVKVVENEAPVGCPLLVILKGIKGASVI